MKPWLFSALVRQNLPHLMGMLIYGAIAIGLASLCYIVFSKIISLNTGLNASDQDKRSAVILAVGIVIGISFLTAITAYEPPKANENAPAQQTAAASSCGNCGKPTGKQAQGSSGVQQTTKAPQKAVESTGK